MSLKLAALGGALALALGGVLIAPRGSKDPASDMGSAASIADEEFARLAQADAPEAKTAPAKTKGPPPAAFPNTDDGLPIMQLGVGGVSYVSLEDPFVNILRTMNTTAWAAIKLGGETMSFADMLTQGYVDPRTMLPRAVPPGFAYVRSGLFRFGARYYPEYYGGTYVVEWDGKAKAKCGFGKTANKIEKNRIECFYPSGDRDWSNIEFHEIGEGFANPRLYRKENEAIKDQLFSPQFLAHLRHYKVIRTMDLQATNTNWTRSVDDLATMKHLTWGDNASIADDEGKAIPRAIPRGVPIEALFDMAVASDTALWMHVAGPIGAPADVDDPSFLDGKKEIRGYARQHAKEILASPEWRKYADEIVRSMKASGYPANRMLYIEQANEVWNFAFPFWRMTHYFWGLGEGIKGDNSAGFSWGLGYVTAHFAVIFDAALKDAGRAEQPWVAVLAGQMAYSETTKGALRGFTAYFADHDIDPSPYLARLGVSTASYYQGVFEENATNAVVGGSPSDGDWSQRWLKAIKTDPEALQRRATDFIINGSPDIVGTIPNLVRQRKEHQKLAEEAGAFFLGDYEGESHENGGGPLKQNPTFVNWTEDWRSGPQGERMTRAWIEAMQKQNPNAVISNFTSIGPRDPEGDAPTDKDLMAPWVDNFWDEETGRTRALNAYLRKE